MSLEQDYNKNKSIVDNNVSIQKAIDVLEKIKQLLSSGVPTQTEQIELSKYFDVFLNNTDIQSIMNKLGHYQKDVDGTGKETFKVFDYAKILDLPKMIESFRDFMIGEDMFLVETYKQGLDDKTRYQRVIDSANKLSELINVVNQIIGVLTTINSSLVVQPLSNNMTITSVKCVANKFLKLSTKPESNEIIEAKQKLAKLSVEIDLLSNITEDGKQVNLSTPDERLRIRKLLESRIMDIQQQIEKLLCSFTLRPDQDVDNIIKNNLLFLQKLQIISMQMKSYHVSRDKSGDTLQLSLRELTKALYDTSNKLIEKNTSHSFVELRNKSDLPPDQSQQSVLNGEACKLEKSSDKPYIEEVSEKLPVQSMTEIIDLLRSRLKLVGYDVTYEQSMINIKHFFEEQVIKNINAYVKSKPNLEPNTKENFTSAIQMIQVALKENTIGSISKLIYFLGGDAMLHIRPVFDTNIMKDVGNVLVQIIQKQLIDKGVDKISDYDDLKRKTKLRNKNYLGYTGQKVVDEIKAYEKLQVDLANLRQKLSDDQKRLAVLEDYDNKVSQRDSLKEKLSELGVDDSTNAKLHARFIQDGLLDVNKLRSILDRTIDTRYALAKVYSTMPFIEKTFDSEQVLSAKQRLIQSGGYKLEEFTKQIETSSKLSFEIKQIYLEYINVSTLFKSRFTRMYNLINSVSNNMLNILVYNICKLELLLAIGSPEKPLQIRQYMTMNELTKVSQQLPELLNNFLKTSPFVLLKTRILSALNNFIEKSKTEECVDITSSPNSIDIALCLYFYKNLHTK